MDLRQRHVSRVKSGEFANEHDIGSFVTTWLPPIPNSIPLGSMEPLRRLLDIYDLKNAAALEIELNKLDQTKADFGPFELNTSMCIMDQILRTKGESAKALKETKERYSLNYEAFMLAHVISALHEWSFMKWATVFTQDLDESHQFAFIWLIVVIDEAWVMSILRDGKSPEEMQQQVLQMLWRAFESHENPGIKFVVNLVKMGVFFDCPDHLYLLRRKLWEFRWFIDWNGKCVDLESFRSMDRKILNAMLKERLGWEMC
jgi:hypothetical protein